MKFLLLCLLPRGCTTKIEVTCEVFMTRLAIWIVT